jgi:C-terminal processing protease CtpA/Prc
VVSAPPGRIGITFVEFRGHAMVSDVSPSSPLLDWVFPSDILIAIDEVPVSGMRVRDIIKVLTNRKDRQRALRVISSHAMNEFTLNASHMNDTS